MLTNELLAEDPPQVTPPESQAPETVPDQVQGASALTATEVTFKSEDIRGRKKVTMADYYRSQTDKAKRAKASGRRNYSPKRTFVSNRISFSSHTTPTTNKSHTTTPTTTKPSAAKENSAKPASNVNKPTSAGSTSACPTPPPGPTSARPTPPPGFVRTTRNEAYLGPHASSKAYKELKSLMDIPEKTPVKYRLGKQTTTRRKTTENTSIKSRLGAHKSAMDRLSPKVTGTLPAPQAPVQPPAPTSSSTPPSLDRMGLPAPSGKYNSKRNKRFQRPNQSTRRHNSTSTSLISS